MTQKPQMPDRAGTSFTNIIYTKLATFPSSKIPERLPIFFDEIVQKCVTCLPMLLHSCFCYPRPANRGHRLLPHTIPSSVCQAQSPEKSRVWLQNEKTADKNRITVMICDVRKSFLQNSNILPKCANLSNLTLPIKLIIDGILIYGRLTLWRL